MIIDGPKTEDKDEGSMSSNDPYGIGMNADGTLNVIAPEDLAKWIAERDAWESSDPDEDLDDVSDLDDEPDAA